MIKIVFILFSFFIFNSFGQDCEKVLFRGKVSDTLRPQSFYNLMVINKTTGRGVFGQPNGSFYVYASPGDTISLSCKGYSVISEIVKPDSNCQHIVNIYISGKAQEIQEVVVRPIKSLAQIREERSTLAMRETRMVTGIEVLQSPITALYQAFSKKERSKRTVAEWEHSDNQNRIVQELLRTYVAFNIIELTPDEFEKFVEFLNIDENFLKTASEMELITFIQDKFEHYLILKKVNE
ncbi:MAG: hypothetical protein KC454_02165 [Flavobacteriales bacterium]|nr:hypothetical protein [Flavobacteriales bacterium]